MNVMRLKRKEAFALTSGGDSLCGWQQLSILHDSALQTLEQSSLKLAVILFDATSQIRDLSSRPFGAIISINLTALNQTKGSSEAIG